VAQKLKARRHQHGTLDLETIEARPVFDGDETKDLEADEKNRAKDIIEDFMIAANGVTARYLASKKFPLLRRAVRIPKRWDRIIELAAEQGSTLPKKPDSKALDQFLVSAKTCRKSATGNGNQPKHRHPGLIMETCRIRQGEMK
jgi:exoribonuclease R